MLSGGVTNAVNQRRQCQRPYHLVKRMGRRRLMRWHHNDDMMALVRRPRILRATTLGAAQRFDD